MCGALVVPEPAAIVVQQPALPELAHVVEAARDYAYASKAENTKRAYKSDWMDFSAWCQAHARAHLPADPTTVALYISALAEVAKVSTINRRLAAISVAHQGAGYESPTRHIHVRTVLAGIRRTLGVKQDRKAPATAEELKAMIGTLDDTLAGRRDRALLLVGFSGAFRRSELVALDVADCTFVREGVILTLHQSKTNQEGDEERKALPKQAGKLCPVAALRAWLDAAAITTGPVFRSVNRGGKVSDRRLSDKAVALVVKRCAEEAGLDSARFAGHSLRAGFVTSASRKGVPDRKIMRQTGHKSVDMLNRYDREEDLFRGNAAADLGL